MITHEIPYHRPRRLARLQRALAWLGFALLIYFFLSYEFMPAAWRHRALRHPALDDVPRITRTKDGIPGDPLNLAVLGTEEELHRAMLEAGWLPADPVTFRSSLRITSSTLLRKPYEKAPVSPLFVWGRKQDFAFQQPVGRDPRKRHHVRFWYADWDEMGRPYWIAGATFDTSVGLSHTTGQVTHHIDPDVDTERDKLLKDLEKSGWVEELFWFNGFQQRRQGKNGGGDSYYTDGRLPLVVLTPFTE
jgi:hypothetical protein